MIPYNEFPGFEHIYPEDSFVLSCDETDAEIVFSIDLVLTSTHPSWPAPGSEDTKLGVLMEREVRHGASEVYAGVQA